MSVAEVLQRWPEASGAFLELRMHCLGCVFARFDTVREALALHRVPRAQFMRALQQRGLELAAEKGGTGPS